VARAASDVERSSAQSIDVLPSAHERVDELVDVEDVANLLSVAVDGDGLAAPGADQKMGDPPLVFGPELARLVDAAHSEDDRAEPERLRVVEHVLVGGPLAAPVRAVERESSRFGDPTGLELLVDGHVP